MNNKLEFLRPSHEVKTSGTDWHMHTVDMSTVLLEGGDGVIRQVFRKIFEVKSFLRWGKVLCWYDRLSGVGDPKHYQTLNGFYIMGCFYNICDGSIDIASHFFMRRLDDFHGSYDKWREDLIFPTGTKKFSACIIPPKGYVQDELAMCDPHNHAVAMIPWERIEEMGIDLTTLINTMTAEEYACAPPTEPVI